MISALLFVFNQAADLVIQLSSSPKSKQDVFAFGTVFTDHMLTIEWTLTEGWQAPLIKPFGNLSLHPACSALHYGVQVHLMDWSQTSVVLVSQLKYNFVFAQVAFV